MTEIMDNDNKNDLKGQILDTVLDAHIEELIKLKDDIMTEQDNSVAKKKERIFYDTIEFFKIKCRSIKNLDSDNDSFFQLSSSDNYDIDESDIDNSDIDSKSSDTTDTTYYSDTESEYNFDGIDENLKEDLDNVMERVNITLKKKDNLGQIRINKKRNYL